MEEDNKVHVEKSIAILDRLIEKVGDKASKDLIDKIKHIKSSIDLMNENFDLTIYQTIQSQFNKEDKVKLEDKMKPEDKVRTEEIKEAIKNLSIEVGNINLNRYEEEFSEDTKKEFKERVESIEKAANICEEVRKQLSDKLKQRYEEELIKWAQENDYQENEKIYKGEIRATSKGINFMTADISHYERQSKK